jgi:acetamidase/formamidase
MLASNHGGNIDHPDLVEGSTLFLPVHVVGGLLYMGDMHAAQGHGETAGGGLEVSGRATVKISVKKGLTLTCPRYETSSGIACLAVEKTFEASAKMALANLIQWISSCGWNIYDASMLINQSCEFRVGGMSDSYTVVSCFVSKSSLPQDAITEISCCDALE